MLSRVILFFLAVLLNSLHFIIPAKVINYSFDPFIGLLSLLGFMFIVYFTSSFKKDLIFVMIIVASFATQVVSFYLNNQGVPDYINLLIINSNIPDFLITATLLTWWYYRVYKQSKLDPADELQDV